MSFDEQPDGDIHGECHAEIERLEMALHIKTLERDELAAQFNGFDPLKLPPILISCVARLWPGSGGMFWEQSLERMPDRINELKTQRDEARSMVELAQDVTAYQTAKQERDELAAQNAMLWTALRICREYPDFDDGGPLADRIDNALALPDLSSDWLQKLKLAGWKEAAIAWEVCASIHEKFAKSKDPLYSTRHADFERHAEDARRRLSRDGHNEANTETENKTWSGK